MLFPRKALFKSRRDAAVATQDGIYCDPIEKDERYIALLSAADAETEKQLAGVSREMGYCHRYWQLKQKILLESYGVIWFTPSEMNPGALFD